MSAVFRPGQRVRCARNDEVGIRVAQIGDVKVVDCLVDHPNFLPGTLFEADKWRWWSAHFTPADQPGPWTDHDGGACPVGPDVRVEVRLRDKSELRAKPSRTFSNGRWLWHRAPGDDLTDITHYRLAADPPEAEPGTEPRSCPMAELTGACSCPPDRLADGIAAIKAEVLEKIAPANREEVAYREGLMDALVHLGIRTTIHPPQPARVEFTEAPCTHT